MRPLHVRRAATLATALLIALSSVTVDAAAQRRGAKRSAPPLAPFLGSLEEAGPAARERNVPLLIHIILEGEEQNDEYRDKILPDELLRELSLRTVVIVSNNGEHPPRTITEEVDGRRIERQVCSAYPMFERCEQHRQTWDPIYFEYHDESGEMRCPQTILLSPTGELAWRHNIANPPEIEEVRVALEKAQKAAGPGLTQEELTDVRRFTSAGRLATADQHWARALRAWREVVDRIGAGPLFEEAQAGSEAAQLAMKGELEKVVKLLVPGSAKQGYMQLVQLSKEVAGTPFAADARSALAAADRDKEIRDEVRAAKLELEAEELWAESQELSSRGEERRSQALVRRILRKKYRETDVAQRAREKYPEIAAEEERGGS